ncbi:MAG: DUF2934 domain-containing protein [Terracidiphilus sp.]|jgi:hypothetical protein
MIVSKAQKQPKLNRVVVAAPKASPAKSPIVAASEPHASASQRQIRELAFENFEKRGSEPGHDQQDWFRAERQILAQ